MTLVHLNLKCAGGSRCTLLPYVVLCEWRRLVIHRAARAVHRRSAGIRYWNTRYNLSPEQRGRHLCTEGLQACGATTSRSKSRCKRKCEYKRQTIAAEGKGREKMTISLLVGSNQLALLTVQGLFSPSQLCVSSFPASMSDPASLESTSSPLRRKSRTSSSLPPERIPT